MENQHRKISGYRELSQHEIDLMNRIKAKGAEMLDLHYELFSLLNEQHKKKSANAIDLPSDHCAELERFMSAEPFRWLAIGKTDIQTGIMALIRAVAQPQDA